MKREQQQLAQFMYSANHAVKLTDTKPTFDELRTSFCLMYEEVTALFEAKNIIAIAEALGNIVFAALWSANHLNIQPCKPFLTLQGVLEKVSDDMQRDKKEVNFVPLITRDVYTCLKYEQQISRLVSDFINTEDEGLRVDALTDVIQSTCAYSLYLGLNLQDIFNEIYKSKNTLLIDGRQDKNGKWFKGESYRRPQLEHLFMP